MGISMGGLLEHLRENEHIRSLERLANWDHLVQPENIEQTFIETLEYFYRKLVDRQIELLLAKDRTSGLSLEEKQELQLLLRER